MSARMNVIVFGLSLSSSWGNGHATTWRSLLRALGARGHHVTFFERDVPCYAAHRDMPSPEFCELVFYRELSELQVWEERVQQADVVIVGSCVPDGIELGNWVQHVADGIKVFYDIDTPVTVAALERGTCEYLATSQIPSWDIYFSSTGGPLLERLEREFGAPLPRALYCSVDPLLYRPVPGAQRWHLSYLGTWSADRHPALERFLLAPARRLPSMRFCVAGARYPRSIEWPANVEHLEHVPPSQHAQFYSASLFTLNLTRADMIAAGWSPSVRLFEAAACETAVISDSWPGLDQLFLRDRELLVVEEGAEVVAAITDPQAATRARRFGRAAGARVRREHTATQRAAALEMFIRDAQLRRTYRRRVPARAAATHVVSNP